MGYKEAMEDGIRNERVKGTTVYYPKCRICGNQVKTLLYRKDVEYLCQSCRMVKEYCVARLKADVDIEKQQKRMQTSIKRIAKVANIQHYSKAIQTVQERFGTSLTGFESTEEVTAAIILQKHGISYRHQVHVGNYRVDFMLDDMKVVLEIDGDIYHSPRRKENEIVRDTYIKQALGDGWNIIRIATSSMNQNPTRLITAIKAVIRQREKLNRVLCSIPSWQTSQRI